MVIINNTMEKAASWNPCNQTQHLYPWSQAEPSPKLCNCDQLQLYIQHLGQHLSR